MCMFGILLKKERFKRLIDYQMCCRFRIRQSAHLLICWFFNISQSNQAAFRAERYTSFITVTGVTFCYDMDFAIIIFQYIKNMLKHANAMLICNNMHCSPQSPSPSAVRATIISSIAIFVQDNIVISKYGHHTRQQATPSQTNVGLYLSSIPIWSK